MQSWTYTGGCFKNRNPSAPARWRPVLLLGLSLAWTGCPRTPESPDQASSSIGRQAATPRLATALEKAARAARSPEAKQEDVVHYAELLHANGYYGPARETWRRLLRSAPGTARFHHLAAHASEQLGDAAAAEAEYLAALQSDATDAAACAKLAEFAYKRGERARARSYYEQRRALIPHDVHARFGLARIRWEDSANASQTEAFRRELAALIEEHPRFSPALNLLATLEREAGNAAAATTLESRAAKAGRYRPPSDPWVEQLIPHCLNPAMLQMLASVEMQSGQLAPAIALFQKAAELAPAEKAYHLALAEALGYQEDHAGALRALEKARQLDAHDAEIYVRMARAWRAMGRTDQALAVLTDGAGQAPGSAELIHERAIVHEAREALAEALRDYRAAISLAPQNPYYRVNLIQLLIANRQLDAAASELAELRRSQPLSAAIQTVAAKLELARDRLPEAATLISTLESGGADVSPLWADWYFQQGRHQAMQDLLAAASISFQTGLEYAPDRAELHANLGVVEAKAGNLPAAAAAFEHAHQLAPQDATLSYYFAGTLLELKQPRRAAAIARQGLDAAQSSNNPALVSALRAIIDAAEAAQ